MADPFAAAGAGRSGVGGRDLSGRRRVAGHAFFRRTRKVLVACETSSPSALRTVDSTYATCLATRTTSPRTRSASPACAGRASSGTGRRASSPGRPTRARCWRRSSSPRRGSRRRRRRGRCRRGCTRASVGTHVGLDPAVAVAVEGEPELAEQRHAAVAERAVHVARHRAGSVPAGSSRSGRVRVDPDRWTRRRSAEPVVPPVAWRRRNVDACPPPSSSTRSGPRSGGATGSSQDWHPVDLAAHTLQALVERNDLDPALVDDVIMGCVMQVGDQAVNVGRNAALAAGLPRDRRRARRSTASAARPSRPRTSRRRA